MLAGGTPRFVAQNPDALKALMQLHPCNLTRPAKRSSAAEYSPANALRDTNPFGAVPLSALLAHSSPMPTTVTVSTTSQSTAQSKPTTPSSATAGALAGNAAAQAAQFIAGRSPRAAATAVHSTGGASTDASTGGMQTPRAEMQHSSPYFAPVVGGAVAPSASGVENSCLQVQPRVASEAFTDLLAEQVQLVSLLVACWTPALCDYT